jgi:hypothetical protein
MKYMMLIYGDEGSFEAAPEGTVTKMSASYAAYTEAMVKAGILVGGERLHRSSAATTVKIANGKTQVLDGPYAEIKEQLGGYYIIDVADLDSALSWAKRCPGASEGAIEVRPVWAMQAA